MGKRGFYRLLRGTAKTNEEVFLGDVSLRKEIVQNSSQNYMSFQGLIASALIFLGLILLLTFPLVLHMNTHIAGYGDDNLSYIWNIWWVSKAILSNQNVYETPLLFHPLGANLVFHTLTPFHGLLAVPLLSFLDLITTFNLIVIFDIWLAAISMYLLVRYMGIGHYAGVFAGMIFAFSPYSVMHVWTHISLAGTGYVVLYFLFLNRFIATGNRSSGIMAGVSAAVIAYSSETYLLISGVATVLWIPQYLLITIHSKNYKRRFSGVLFGTIVFCFLISYLAYQSFLEISKEGYFFQSLRAASITWNADIYSFLSPPNFHWFFRPGPVGAPVEFETFFSCYRPWFRGNVWAGVGLEAVLYVGLPVALLAIWGLIRSRNLKNRFVWMVSGICFFILSLGSILTINGKMIPGNADQLTHLPMPFAYLTDLPILSGMRVPARCHVITSMVIVLFAAAGLHDLLLRIERKKIKLFLLFGVSLLAALDYAAIPWPLTDLRIPPVYEMIHNNSSENSSMKSIMDLPPGWRVGDYLDFTERTVFQYYQTYHGYSIPYGMIARVPPWQLDYFQRNRMLNWFKSETADRELVSSLESAKQWAQATTEVFNIKYIIVHKNTLFHNKVEPVLTETQYERTCQDVSNVFNVKNKHVFPDETLFTIEEPKDPIQVVDFLEPWSTIFIANGLAMNWEPMPWLSQKAALLVPFQPGKSGHCKLTIKSFYGETNDPPQHMRVFVNNRFYTTIEDLNLNWQTIDLDVPANWITKVPTKIDLEFSRARSPYELFHEADTRALAARLKSMEWFSRCGKLSY